MGAYGLRGSRIVNSLYWPTLLSSVMLPPCCGQLIDLATVTCVQQCKAGRRGLLQLAQEIDRAAGEVVDEVQRGLDLVRDGRGELAE